MERHHVMGSSMGWHRRLGRVQTWLEGTAPGLPLPHSRSPVGLPADKAQAPPVAGDDVMRGGGLTQSCGRAHPYAADAYELDVVLRAAVV